MKNYTLSAIRYTLCLVFIFSLLGCEAFVRKFTRKPKKENLPQEEMVISPQEYTGLQMSKEELYRQYLLFWKSWHDELISVLTKGANHKKQIDSANEAIKNLEQLKSLLPEEKQRKIKVYINRLSNLKSLITKDIYGTNIDENRSNAERIKRNILRDFSYNDVKGSLL